MIRPLLAVMAGLLCGVMGMRQSKRIHAENALLRRWQEMLQHLCLLLREGALSMPEAFEAAADGSTQADAQLLRLAGAMREHPMTSLPDFYLPQGKAGPALARMFAGLSRGSLENRLLAAEQAGREIALLADTAQTKAQQDARMWTTLGWTCGACLTLMLL